MCDHWAMSRRVESTSGSRDGCGLLYLPTSAKAVTRREPSLGFFTRNDGFRYSTVIPTSSGRQKVVKLLLELNELISCILGKATFSLKGLDRANVDLCFVVAGGSIVPEKLGIKYGVVLSEKGVEVCPDGLG